MKPEAGELLFEVFPMSGEQEPEQTSEEVLDRTREIRESPTGTAGRDEESARIIKARLAQRGRPAMDDISAPEDMVPEENVDG